MEIRQALTFDDVMLVPAASSILPGAYASISARMRLRMAWVSGRFSLLVPSRSIR